MNKKSRHHSLYGFIGLVCALLGLLFYFLFIPNPYLTPFLLGWVNKQGWGTFEVERIALHPHEILLKGVKYTPAPEIPSLKMGSANLEITWEKFSPKIQGVILKNLIISKETIENMMGSSSTSTFPMPPIAFENAILSSEDQSFPFNLSFDGKFIPGLSFDGRLHLIFSAGTFHGTLKAILATPQIKAKLSDLSLNLKGWEQLPLSGEGELTMENNKIKANISSSGPDFKLESQCKYAIQDQTGNCVLAYQFNKLATIIPKSLLQNYSLQDFSGTMKGSTNLTVKNGAVNPIEGTAIFSHISFEHPHIKIKDLSTSLRYSFDKILSFPKQGVKVLIENADMGVSLSNLQLKLLWDGGDHYHLQEGIGFLEGGQVTTKDVFFSLPFKELHLPLKLKNIPAQSFVTLSHVPDLMVSGHVEGQLDMEFTEQAYGIKKGSSLSIQDPPGKIRYRPGLKPKQILTLKGDENPMDLVFLALWNFKYEKLSLDLEKPLQGQLQATLHLKGKNPNLLDGHPFEFNIKASGQLKELIENLFQSIKNP